MEPPHNHKGECVSMTKNELKKILEQHRQWLNGNGGCRANLRGANLRGVDLRCADLSGANLSCVDLSGANLCGADLRGANLHRVNLCDVNLSGADLRNADLCDADLCRANLSGADLCGVNLCGADLCGANLSGINLCDANLRGANLRGANLRGADLCGSNLSDANLCGANLSDANLCGVDLSGANLRGVDLCGAELSDADLSGAKNMVKVVGVFPGNRYYKAIDENLCNNGYIYTVGLNTLREGEVFASDDRVLCSFPGFHFASESWCRTYYGNRRYLCLIRIPTKEEYEQIEINEPWATDGKASASAIIIEKVFDTKDGDKDVTDRFIGWADGKGNKT